MAIGHLGQTITVVDKSNKVVSTSKQLFNVFREAKAAYNEKKAEIKATRRAVQEEKRALRAPQQATLEDDTRSRRSSRSSRHPHRTKSSRHNRPPVERGYTDSFSVNDAPRRRSSAPQSPRSPRSPGSHHGHLAGIEHNELVRRHTETDLNRRKNSESSIDLDLAYGELPPPLPQRHLGEEEELQGQMSKLQVMLDEAKCLQHSATATIENLQKNPEALAAVALTLAEISNLAAKMAPGALAALKGSFPAVMALLASPHFLIACGVGVGVTVVALGGYKIIKKIAQKRENERELEEPLAMQEIDVDVDLNRIEAWRRGIADVQAESLGSTVDGELITPIASNRLIAEGVLKPDDIKSTKSGKSRKSRKHGDSDSHSKARSMRDDSKSKSGKSEKKEKKKKEPSVLKLMFKKQPSQLV